MSTESEFIEEFLEDNIHVLYLLILEDKENINHFQKMCRQMEKQKENSVFCKTVSTIVKTYKIVIDECRKDIKENEFKISAFKTLRQSYRNSLIYSEGVKE
jgi:CRISPR/Cas system-associated endoribonuclease Cas2